MSLLDTLYAKPVPVDASRARRETPMGDPEQEFAAAEAWAREQRNRKRRKQRAGMKRIGGQTRMQIVYGVVAKQPGIAPKEIAQVIGLEFRTVYVALSALREQGYVEMRDWPHAYVTSKAPPRDRRGERWEVGIRAISRWRYGA